MTPEAAMAFWIFKCNPDKYSLRQRLTDPNPVITWSVNQHTDEIKTGDIAFLWEIGEDRGIAPSAFTEHLYGDMAVSNMVTPVSPLCSILRILLQACPFAVARGGR